VVIEAYDIGHIKINLLQINKIKDIWCNLA
jgi:hypothetical protein